MNMLLISNHKHTSDGRIQYMSMFTPDELRGFAKQGKSWRDVAVAQTLPEKTVVGYEKALFMRCVALAHKYNALMFFMPLPRENECEQDQIATLCQLHDVIVSQQTGELSLKQWRKIIERTQIMPVGQPYQPQSPYHRMAKKLNPMLS
ncbi:hypothetical protein [Alysiella filiformis]|uniref:Uncharacterized protein n=1 Tax=Alysiella filiformis DSM 16848 TaxID=1120981 RepID=A0A286E668_9NEIS|nr:hypothetical protein [Alysiella filiformis]QMT31463.1 hypothetical protein H3L97_00670 [Alysiella filiformis]UBQ55525.1 hypothetical protein JF568_08005 [Alysiella filiformis DSM 16848]SOD66397.1 hypothetical protein SAMN02746062_00591 [Alysiella filiformis DSM 16848]